MFKKSDFGDVGAQIKNQILIQNIVLLGFRRYG